MKQIIALADTVSLPMKIKFIYQQRGGKISNHLANPKLMMCRLTSSVNKIRTGNSSCIFLEDSSKTGAKI